MHADSIPCTFCGKFSLEPTQQRHPVFDQIIFQDDAFVVIPAVGSFVEGYLLIVPREHFLNLAGLPSRLLAAFSRIKSRVRDELSARFAPPVFFEHGLVCLTNRAGSCIDHAHLHCVPLTLDIVPRLASTHQLTRIGDFTELSALNESSQSYLYFENQRQEKFAILNAAVPSQYLRRLIAEELGMPDEWDWAATPFESKARKTLSVLTG